MSAEPAAKRWLIPAVLLLFALLAIWMVRPWRATRPAAERSEASSTSGASASSGGVSTKLPIADSPAIAAAPVTAPVAPRQPAEQAFPGLESNDLAQQKSALLELMQRELELSADAIARVRAIFDSSSWLSQGNPKITQHPMTRAECRTRREAAAPLPAGDSICGKPHMVALYGSSRGESVSQAKACIDQYEFPGIPCEYPLIWVRADQAVDLCKAVGKRICDAHEWEGACAGDVRTPEEDYAFGQRRLMIEYLHNKDRELVWSYGKTKDHSKCATGSRKSPQCSVIDWELCGSNTYPAGAFPECRSSFGAFDLNGNAAEHMNLPLSPQQLASRGGLGETEMKGSWFIFSMYEAHADDCRFRAPGWHKSRIDDRGSHRNYHLGFRCCADVPGVGGAAAATDSKPEPSSVPGTGSGSPASTATSPRK